MNIRNRSKAKRYAKLVAKMKSQSERLNRVDSNGERHSCSIALEQTIARSKTTRYHCAVKDRAFRPEYVQVKAIYAPILIKKNRHGKDVLGSRLIGYVTLPIRDKNNEGIKRPIPCYRDGTPRFSCTTNEIKENAS